MPVSQVELSVEAKGNKASTLKEGEKVAFKGLRWGIDPKQLTDAYSFADLGVDLGDLATKLGENGKGVTAKRFAELIDSNVFNVRIGQDANRNFMLDEGRAPTQEEADKNMVERANGTGRGGARGPRLSTEEIFSAAKNLPKKFGAKFQQYADYVDNTPLSKATEAAAYLRSVFTEAQLSIEQVKELAKGV